MHALRVLYKHVHGRLRKKSSELETVGIALDEMNRLCEDAMRSAAQGYVCFMVVVVWHVLCCAASCIVLHI